MKIKIMVLITFLMLSFYTDAQISYLSQVSAKNVSVEKKDTNLRISMDLDLGKMRVNAQHRISITPILVNELESKTLELSPVVIHGSVRDKVIIRKHQLNGQPLFNGEEPFAIIRRKNHTRQQVAYRVSVTMQLWMRNARLVLQETVTGCAECQTGQNQTLIAENLLPEPFIPVYKLTYIVPEVEAVKKRCEDCVARFSYKVASFELLPDFANNTAEFSLVHQTVTEVQSNKDITLTDLIISGYASPEGNEKSNMLLSQQRANAFAEYLTERYGLNRNNITVKHYGEDWNGLVEAVEQSDLSDKEAILSLIREENNPDRRDALLKKLSGGATYATLLSQYYPPLRRNEYLIHYVVKPFDVEKAKQLIRANPKLLSLHEMYQVAESYPVDSKEFKEVFDIAAQMFPDDAIAVINVAAADMELGNNRSALNRLLKIERDSRAWNNIGVAYARMGDTDKAKEYFDKASGDADAMKNKEQLRQWINSK